MTKDPRIAILLVNLDQAFDRKSWHGTNLKGAIKGLSAQVAAWRPGPERLNIWEHVLHAAYWKYIVRRRLLSETKGSFPLQGSNWFVRPEPGMNLEKQWKADVRLLIDTHKSLRKAIDTLPPKELDLTPPGSKVSNLMMLTGIAAHDLYHTGQIQLLKRLQKDQQVSANR